MANPEGYRKALRLMRWPRSSGPINLYRYTGAYPGIGDEERGQDEAIARNLMVMSVWQFLSCRS